MDSFVNKPADDTENLAGVKTHRRSLKDIVNDMQKIQREVQDTPLKHMADVAEKAMQDLLTEAKGRRKSLELDEGTLQGELKKMEALLERRNSHQSEEPPRLMRRRSSTGQDLKTFTLEELRAMAAK
eukprot:TRINITY_DN16518_c0_g1::TRINITY_DN16518_c0_g1_i1::g.1913::m.1913 TRINITY_DN16518_c0_g1::TRINITY_DN16518_c0_g1_i1::g.1913  ORF type:complete len:127 (-),score=31.75,HU-DNA_bdg/PF14848.1/0.11 TRINITY_DN16518_c0_g1_i1:669-1049(-)